MIRMRFKLTKIRDGHDGIRVARLTPIEDKEIDPSERPIVGKAAAADLDVVIDNPAIAEQLKVGEELYLTIEVAPGAARKA